ncbi:UNVERIFIED_CONTAM: hypothetical protein FKN15_040054 [Acipenser sinensis]
MFTPARQELLAAPYADYSITMETPQGQGPLPYSDHMTPPAHGGAVMPYTSQGPSHLGTPANSCDCNQETGRVDSDAVCS